MPKRPSIHRRCKDLQSQLNAAISGKSAQANLNLRNIPASQDQQTPIPIPTPKVFLQHPDRSMGAWRPNFIAKLLPQARGRQRQHFGPKARIPDLFQRRDKVYLELESRQLEWYAQPPIFHHDLLDAAAKVGRIEGSIGYTFKNKLLCVEALKSTGGYIPLYYKGIVNQVRRNNRLALLGDRILGLALCEIWFHSGYAPGEQNDLFFATC